MNAKLSFIILSMAASLAMSGCEEVKSATSFANQHLGLNSSAVCYFNYIDISDSISQQDKSFYQQAVLQNNTTLNDKDEVFIYSIGENGASSYAVFAKQFDKTGKYKTDQVFKSKFNDELKSSLNDLLSQQATQTRIFESMFASKAAINSCGKQGKTINLLILSDMIQFNSDKKPIDQNVLTAINPNGLPINVFVMGAGKSSDGIEKYTKTESQWRDAFSNANMTLHYYGKNLIDMNSYSLADKS